MDPTRRRLGAWIQHGRLIVRIKWREEWAKNGNGYDESNQHKAKHPSSAVEETLATLSPNSLMLVAGEHCGVIWNDCRIH
jgi:hypothetical protein